MVPTNLMIIFLNVLSDGEMKILMQFDQISLGFPNDCSNNSFEAYSGLPSDDRLIDKRPHCTNYWSKDLEVTTTVYNVSSKL